MNIVPDLLFERESLRAQIKHWKWLFFIALIIFIIVIGRSSLSAKHQDLVARVRLDGVIEYSPELIDKLKSLGEDSKIKAIILHINSPGSTAFAGEELYVTLKKISQNKPVISVLETVAASGGYMAALGTDYILARNMTITGSIGVLWQSFEVVEMANKLGIKFIEIKSSPLKASPNPMEIMTPEVKAVAMETVDDSYQIFLKMLMESRKMDKNQAIKLADGRIYTGMRAKELNLIDAIGGEDEALAWLEGEKKIPAKTKVIDVELEKPESITSELAKFFRNTNSIFGKLLNKSNSGVLAY